MFGYNVKSHCCSINLCPLGAISHFFERSMGATSVSCSSCWLSRCCCSRRRVCSSSAAAAIATSANKPNALADWFELKFGSLTKWCDGIDFGCMFVSMCWVLLNKLLDVVVVAVWLVAHGWWLQLRLSLLIDCFTWFAIW